MVQELLGVIKINHALSGGPRWLTQLGESTTACLGSHTERLRFVLFDMCVLIYEIEFHCRQKSFG